MKKKILYLSAAALLIFTGCTKKANDSGVKCWSCQITKTSSTLTGPVTSVWKDSVCGLTWAELQRRNDTLVEGYSRNGTNETITCQ